VNRSFAAVLVLASAFAAQAQTANPQVELKTTRGAIVIELYADKAPKSTANFLQYVKAGHYKGTVFHRIINGFVIQGGGFDTTMNQKPTRAPIENEASNGLRNERGTLAMARTMDPNSATSQFYINLSDNAALNYASPDKPGYAVFGKVVQGMDVVDSIAKSPTSNSGSFRDVPREPIVMESATVLSK
jgi:peptidyl-prolyl cis-trans isomerase A (cyclophilin A)